MLEKESSTQEVPEEYLLGKYGEEARLIVTNVRWAEGTYEQDMERY